MKCIRFPAAVSKSSVQDNVCVEAVGYLLEELRNPETLEAFRKDVESANMFIGSLIFVQEASQCKADLFSYWRLIEYYLQLAEKVVEVVQPLREKLDAVLIFPSMPDVMRLNKVHTSISRKKIVGRI